MKIYKRRLPYLVGLFLLTGLMNCAGNRPNTQPEYLANVSSRNLEIDSTVATDPAVEALIEPYRATMQKTMGEVIGYAAVDLNKGKPEAPLNNFIADLMLKRANKEFGQQVDMAITNIGGLRRNIPQGPVTRGMIYEVMPFENELVVLTMTGTQMKILAMQIGDVHGEPVAGVKIEYRNGKFMRLTIGSENVEPEKTYYVVTTDFLSSPGRDKLAILGEVPKELLGVRLRDAIIDEVEALNAEGKKISAKVDGRIVYHQMKLNRQ
jgi:2',3'-cyclic-nucleotide 2'-phosphodiesterase (5'-nucleotidase family)